jgi:hypothetical protein
LLFIPAESSLENRHNSEGIRVEGVGFGNSSLLFNP